MVWLHGLNSRYQRKYTEPETDCTCLDFLILVDIVNFCSLVTCPMIIGTGNMNLQYLVYVYLHCCFFWLLFIIDYIYFGNYLPVNILCIYHVNMYRYIIDLALYIWFCRYKQNYMYIQVWGIFEFIRAKYVIYINYFKDGICRGAVTF